MNANQMCSKCEFPQTNIQNIHVQVSKNLLNINAKPSKFKSVYSSSKQDYI